MAVAMSVNKKYENQLVTGEDWRQLARVLAIDPDQMTTWVHDVVSRAPDAMSDAVRAEDKWISNLTMAHELVDGVASNAKSLQRRIEPPVDSSGTNAGQRPTKPTVSAYRKADGTYVKEHPNPRHRD